MENVAYQKENITTLSINDIKQGLSVGNSA